MSILNLISEWISIGVLPMVYKISFVWPLMYVNLELQSIMSKPFLQTNYSET